MRNGIITIMKKELARFFGDKRLVVSILLPGVLIYVMYSFMGSAMKNNFGVDERYTPTVQAVNLPVSMEALLPQTGFAVITGTDVAAAKEAVTAQELEDLWPELSPKEREDAWTREHPTTFLMGIGGALKSGKPHDGRAPDYDDWGLNGDILLWNPLLNHAFEISSMGIRVSPESLDEQLTAARCGHRRELPFHRALLAGELPLTIGGGIGQSRVSMYLLGKAHIGEVQASIWDPRTIQACREAGVILL